jgi:K+-transporting ATPase ATPase C chain
VLTGIIYPLLITGIAQVAFPHKANGSLIKDGDKIIGSELIGQQFDSTIYFMGRPSATSYNPLPSGGSNYGLTNEKLKNIVEERRRNFIKFNQLDNLTEVPAEMLFASASGLDPHISPQAALLQVERVAKARGFDATQTEQLRKLVDMAGEKPQFLILGNERVNVLLLNLEVDKIK